MMANPNPVEARLARKRRRTQAGTIRDLTRVLWRAIQRLDEHLADADRDLDLKAVHALSQIAGAYTRAVEVGEIEARLEAVEQQLINQEGKGQQAWA
jgi:hypothetical protein